MAYGKHRRAVDPPLLAILIASLLLAAFKDDASLAFNSDRLSDFISHPWVTALRQRIVVITLPVIVTAVAWSVPGARYRADFTAAAVLVCLLPLYAAFRSAFETADMAVKPLQAFVLFAFLANYMAFRRANTGARAIHDTAASAFFLFAAILVGINLFTYATGHGYVGTSRRFFGTSVHPNFIGVQMALCGIIFAHFTIKGRGWSRALAAALLVAALLLAVQSGSRTAAVVFAVGCYVGVWRFLGIVSRIAAVLALCAGLSILLTSGWALEEGTVAAYDRDGAFDTRSAAWLYLIDQIGTRPLLGLGVFEGASENSLLRGWSAFGLPYFLTMTAVLVLAARAFYQVNRQGRSAMLMSGLFCGLVAGSLFEGYLCDNLTVPIVTFVIVVSAAYAPERRRKRLRLPAFKTRKEGIADPANARAGA